MIILWFFYVYIKTIKILCNIRYKAIEMFVIPTGQVTRARVISKNKTKIVDASVFLIDNRSWNDLNILNAFREYSSTGTFPEHTRDFSDSLTNLSEICWINMRLHLQKEMSHSRNFRGIEFSPPTRREIASTLRESTERDGYTHTWHLQTMSASIASMSTTFPLPSSPHCAPRTTVIFDIEPPPVDIRCFFLGEIGAPLPFACCILAYILGRLRLRRWSVRAGVPAENVILRAQVPSSLPPRRETADATEIGRNDRGESPLLISRHSLLPPRISLLSSPAPET